MIKYKAEISYDGHNYNGFQIQDDLPTIELEIVKAFKKMLGTEVKIYASGRTDKSVHAKGQVIHFELENDIPPLGVKKGLNAFLPQDIYFKNVEYASVDFHARFSVKSKEYRYYINTGDYDPLKANYAINITYLDVDRMKEAITHFIGEHDFKGFASSSIDKRKSTIKEVYDAHINVLDNGYLEFVFIGTGFLKYQIRRMMGLLVEIGRGKEESSMIDYVLDKKDPSISHKCLDGCGLYLYKVNY